MKHEIILYSTNCARCKALKMKLQQLHLEYTLNEDESGENILVLGMKTAPVLSIDGELFDFTHGVDQLNKMRE